MRSISPEKKNNLHLLQPSSCSWSGGWNEQRHTHTKKCDTISMQLLWRDEDNHGYSLQRSDFYTFTFILNNTILTNMNIKSLNTIEKTIKRTIFTVSKHFTDCNLTSFNPNINFHTRERAYLVYPYCVTFHLWKDGKKCILLLMQR